MNETTYTPGPWQGYRQGTRWVVDSSRETIAYVQTMNMADVSLIAAAPEMLELLQEITGTECLGHWSDLQKRVLAVIEKTGNSV